MIPGIGNYRLNGRPAVTFQLLLGRRCQFTLACKAEVKNFREVLSQPRSIQYAKRKLPYYGEIAH